MNVMDLFKSKQASLREFRDMLDVLMGIYGENATIEVKHNREMFVVANDKGDYGLYEVTDVSRTAEDLATENVRLQAEVQS